MASSSTPPSLIGMPHSSKFPRWQAGKLALTSPAPDSKEFMLVRMTVDDASAYLEGLIVDYIDEETSKASIVSEDYVPWYKGGIKGVPAHKAVWYCCKLVWETFANNPYGLSPVAYLIAGSAMLAVLYGNFILAVIKGYQDESWLTFFGCLVNGLVVFWSFPFFLHPALIANVQQQYAALGLPVDN
jgi:hypothetical protein